MSLAQVPAAPWLLAGALVLVAYRAMMAALLQALHGLPSLQRRRILEEANLDHPLLERLLGQPQHLELGVGFWNQVLLLLLLALLWPLEAGLPGGLGSLLVLLVFYVWLMDIALPALWTASDPALWIRRLFPVYAPVHPLAAVLVGPILRHLQARRERLERDRTEEEEPTEEAVTALLEEGEAEGILEAGDRELIRNVVEFGDTVVREVMTPRTRILSLPLEATDAVVWETFRRSRHSRLPLFEGTADRVVGLLLMKDLLQHPAGHPLDLRAMAKPVLFVPESKAVLDLLRELQRNRAQMAMVVDEYGSVSGLVTMEDLLEEVFGEIREEHELPPDEQALPEGQFLVEGTLHVEELEARLGQSWVREGFDTVAGLILSRLGRMPQPGEVVNVEGARLVVTRMDGLRIRQVRVEQV